MRNRYFAVIEDLLKEVEEKQAANVTKAAEIIAESIMSGGILQAFGSGHSMAAAIEITGRAGGLIPAKQIREPAQGKYEQIEGVGTIFCQQLDVRKEDVVVLISNSGRNPLSIEIAIYCKSKGAKVIVFTSLEASKKLTSKHSAGKNLWEYADVVIDNGVMDGDASIEVEGLPYKVGGTSSVSVAVLENAMMLEAIEIMVKKGFTPPVFVSSNVDYGQEHNMKYAAQYFDRLFHV